MIDKPTLFRVLEALKMHRARSLAPAELIATPATQIVTPPPLPAIPVEPIATDLETPAGTESIEAIPTTRQDLTSEMTGVSLEHGAFTPSPGTPGEGWGGGLDERCPSSNAPSQPPPEYRERRNDSYADLIRPFLYLGTMFLALSIFTMIYYASAQLHWIWYVAGIVLGGGIITFFALFEKKRSQMLALVDGLKQWQ